MERDTQWVRADRSFFIQSAARVGSKLLGCVLCSNINGEVRKGMIVEVEIYPGPHDRASHAFARKKTPRNRAEYYIGGHLYVYLVYGMYWQCNISTGSEGYPSCVLIRAVDPLMPKETIKETNGPGKVCRWFGISGAHYGIDISRSRSVWIEMPIALKRKKIVKGPRIGIDYAGKEWALKPLRFSLQKYKKTLAPLKSLYAQL